MFDVNFHPKQDELNEKIAKVLANTVTELGKISNNYDVDARDLAEQFKGSFDLMVKRMLLS